MEWSIYTPYLGVSRGQFSTFLGASPAALVTLIVFLVIFCAYFVRAMASEKAPDPSFEPCKNFEVDFDPFHTTYPASYALKTLSFDPIKSYLPGPGKDGPSNPVSGPFWDGYVPSPTAPPAPPRPHPAAPRVQSSGRYAK